MLINTQRTRVAVGGPGKVYTAFQSKAVAGAAVAVIIRKRAPDLRGGIQTLRSNFQ